MENKKQQLGSKLKNSELLTQQKLLKLRQTQLITELKIRDEKIRLKTKGSNTAGLDSDALGNVDLFKVD